MATDVSDQVLSCRDEVGQGTRKKEPVEKRSVQQLRSF